MEKKENVLKFPSKNIVREIPDEQVTAAIHKKGQKFIDFLFGEVSDMLMFEFDNYNMDTQDKDFSKDFILLMEALRSLISRSVGIDHHFQEFADKNISGVKVVLPKTPASIPQEVIDERIHAAIERTLAELSVEYAPKKRPRKKKAKVGVVGFGEEKVEDVVGEGNDG